LEASATLFCKQVCKSNRYWIFCLDGVVGANIIALKWNLIQDFQACLIGYFYRRSNLRLLKFKPIQA
ncbi:MAG TPA: hypothetical protein PKD51_11245, partial [Saprospiraceae bacterium]|nr:hypothetical protein [Saprospiraceae bacterium]